MTVPDPSLKLFFEEEIVNLDEDTVEEFLSRYPIEQVIQCLFEELKSLEYGDDAGRLGRAFADISQKYSIDTHIYSWLRDSTPDRTKILVSFLAGYYYNAFPNVEILMNFAEEMMENITQSTSLNWDEDTIFLSIESVIYCYHRIKDLVRENKEIQERVQQQVIVFQKYVSNANLASSEHQMIAGMLKTWDLGIS